MKANQDIDNPKRKLHWLCKIFGHKHVKIINNGETYNPKRCPRCFNSVPRYYGDPETIFNGDPILYCLIFGHQAEAIEKNLFKQDAITYCHACHKTTVLPSRKNV